MHDLRVNLNAQLLLFEKLLVATLDDAPGPIREGLAYERVGDVDYPLARQLRQVIIIRQILSADFVALCLLKDVLDSQTHILWERQVTDAVATDELLLSHDEVLEEVDRVVLIGCKVCVAVNSQETISVVLIRLIIVTYTSRLDRYLEANIYAVTC